MANYLDANPDVAENVKTHRSLGQFVPLAVGGELEAFVNARDIRRVTLSRPLDVADYVVGMELLGWRFTALEHDGGKRLLSVTFPHEAEPSSWTEHATTISDAFGPDRQADIFVFIEARDGVLRIPSKGFAQ